MYRLNDYNSIIDYNANSQHQPEKRQNINGKPEPVHKEKRPYNGDRDSNGGNDGRAKILKKYKDNKKNKQKGLYKRVLNLFN